MNSGRKMEAMIEEKWPQECFKDNSRDQKMARVEEMKVNRKIGLISE